MKDQFNLLFLCARIIHLTLFAVIVNNFQKNIQLFIDSDTFFLNRLEAAMGTDLAAIQKEESEKYKEAVSTMGSIIVYR